MRLSPSLMTTLAAAGAVAAVTSCIASAPEGIHRLTDNEGAGGVEFQQPDASTGSGGTGLTSSDPHAVLGADPSHGPFTGGQRIIVVGKGFEPDVRIWFGEREADGVIAIDPLHVQVNAPPGDAGPVELVAQNGDDESTRRGLPAGYSYDALYAEPSSGPVAGGTVITIFGQDTAWSESALARIDQKPCTTVTTLSPTQLSCTVPQGTPGTKSISVTSGDETVVALDAYTYQDSSNGFKGGLSGGPLAGQLKVLVYNNFTGDPVPGAHVIAGDNLATALYAQADQSGLVLFDDPSLTEPVTVTAAAECHSPITFVDVPVDTVTIYLDPVLTPQCAGDGDPPPIGGNPMTYGVISGELVWQGGLEFQKSPWVNVPAPIGANEARVAYVMLGQSDPTRSFKIPSSGYAITPESPGNIGYGFALSTPPGNHTLYALAGILDSAANTFNAYAMGAVKGVAVFPDQTTDQVYLDMMTPLDQALTLDVSPPPPGPKGPDRLHAVVAVEIAHEEYAILPGAQKTPLIPLQAPVMFVGLPPLDDALLGSRYIISTQAVTGPALGAPLSVVGGIATTTTSQPVSAGGFVAVPVLTSPEQNSAWDGTHLQVEYPAGGWPADLTVYEITSGGGVWRWIVAVPAAAHSIELPDLSGLSGAHLPPGPLVIGVYGARFDSFDYGQLGYRQLRPWGMTAYGLDYFNAHL